MDKKMIRFIDNNGNNLFTVPDGENVILTRLDGEKLTLQCNYINHFYAKIGDIVYQIREFAKHMENHSVTYAPELLKSGHTCDTHEIYQIMDIANTDYAFRSFEEAGNKFNQMDYVKMYAGMLAPNTSLNNLFIKHNMDNRPFGDKMRSMSVSDVVILNRSGKTSAFYVDDNFEFIEVPQFLEQQQKVVEKDLLEFLDMSDDNELNTINAGITEVLPKICFSVNKRNQLIYINKGETGYHISEFSTDDFNKNLEKAKELNASLDVTKAQEAAMFAGSTHGWSNHEANPKNYDNNGNLIKQKSKDIER